MEDFGGERLGFTEENWVGIESRVLDGDLERMVVLCCYCCLFVLMCRLLYVLRRLHFVCAKERL